MGSKDLPATIDHIIATTGFESVSYIGHSQGTTQLLAGAALDPDYFNAKINLAVFYAPPFSIKNSTSASDRIASDPHVLPLIQKFIEGAHLYDWLPYGSFFAHTTSKACELLDGHLCKLVLNMFAGGDSKIDMNERLPVMLSYLPAGAGYRDSLHYG
jgi:pimeloyl-ACP methyl ester carboxylesterase